MPIATAITIILIVVYVLVRAVNLIARGTISSLRALLGSRIGSVPCQTGHGVAPIDN